MRKIILLTILLIINSHCSAGIRGSLQLKELEYPASLTGYLYTKDGRILDDKDYETVQKFQYNNTYWGILYGYITIPGDKALINAMRDSIKSSNGDGLVNIVITVQNCKINYIFPLIQILPITPACGILDLNGDIVKEKTVKTKNKK